jgi:DNA polymerase III delta subunit
MLIACIGPDIYRALEKARELETAFRQKFDPEGTSIEHLHQEGTELIDEVIERVNTVSLFTPRRFLRVRDLLKNCPKGRVSALEKALSVDPENVIVVSVECDLPPDATLKVISNIPKWVRYDFGTLDARAFEAWIRDRANGLKCALTDVEVARIVELTEGDTWQASLYVLQAASGVELSALPVGSGSEKERSLFDWADAYLKQDPDWRVAVERLGPDTLLYPFLSQLRTYQRVKAGQDSGIPSFVSRKLKGLRTQNSEEQFARLLEALMLQRQGYAREDELGALF